MNWQSKYSDVDIQHPWNMVCKKKICHKMAPLGGHFILNRLIYYREIHLKC